MNCNEKEAMISFCDKLVEVMSAYNFDLYNKRRKLLEQRRSIQFKIDNVNAMISTKEQKIKEIKSCIHSLLLELDNE